MLPELNRFLTPERVGQETFPALMQRLRGDTEEPTDHGAALASFYADLLNSHTQAGVPIRREELERIDEELSHTAWSVNFSTQAGYWHAVPPQQEYGRADAEAYGWQDQQRAQKGGVSVDGRWYAGGTWVPSTGKHDTDPAVIEKARQQYQTHGQEARQTRQEKMRAAGTTPERLREALASHRGTLSPAEQKSAKRSIAALKAHHGDLVTARLEELVSGTSKALQRASALAAKPGPVGQRAKDNVPKLKAKLSMMAHMLDQLHPEGTVPPGTVEVPSLEETPASTATPRTVPALNQMTAEQAKQAGVPWQQWSEAIRADKDAASEEAFQSYLQHGMDASKRWDKHDALIGQDMMVHPTNANPFAAKVIKIEGDQATVQGADGQTSLQWVDSLATPEASRKWQAERDARHHQIPEEHAAIPGYVQTHAEMKKNDPAYDTLHRGSQHTSLPNQTNATAGFREKMRHKQVLAQMVRQGLPIPEADMARPGMRELQQQALAEKNKAEPASPARQKAMAAQQASTANPLAVPPETPSTVTPVTVPPPENTEETARSGANPLAPDASSTVESPAVPFLSPAAAMKAKADAFNAQREAVAAKAKKARQQPPVKAPTKQPEQPSAKKPFKAPDIQHVDDDRQASPEHQANLAQARGKLKQLSSAAAAQLPSASAESAAVEPFLTPPSKKQQKRDAHQSKDIAAQWLATEGKKREAERAMPSAARETKEPDKADLSASVSAVQPMKVPAGDVPSDARRKAQERQQRHKQDLAPEEPKEAQPKSAMSPRDTVPSMGGHLKGLMRQHKVTIRALADKTGIPLKRIREVLGGKTLTDDAARDWIQAITGTDPGKVSVKDLQSYARETFPELMERLHEEE